MTNDEENSIELRMMLSGLSADLTYGEIDHAKIMLDLLFLWEKSSPNDRRAIYGEYVNQ